MKYILAFLLSTAVFSAVSGQTTFERTYTYGIGSTICPLSNGDFLTGINYPLYGIARMDENGNVLSFQNTNHTTINNIKQANDGGFVYTGMSLVNSYATVSKMDKYGSTLWTKSFVPSGFSASASGILPLTDNTYIFNMSSNGANISMPYQIFKLDDDGNELWRNFPGDALATNHSLINSDHLVIDAYTTRVNDEFGIISITGMDKTTGYTQWSKTIYDPALMINSNYPGFSLAANSSCLSAANEIYVAGTKSLMTDPMTGTSYQFVLKTDVAGNTIWAKTFGEGSFQQINQVADGGLVLIGKDANYEGLMMMKINSNGDSLWSTYFNAFNNSAALDFHETADQGFIVSGYAYEDINQAYYTYIIKTDSQGHVGRITTINTSNESIFHNASFSPTFVHDKAVIQLPAQAMLSDNKAVVIDMSGKVVRSFSLVDVQTEFNRDNLSSGAYTLVIKNSNGSTAHFKFIVE